MHLLAALLLASLNVSLFFCNSVTALFRATTNNGSQHARVYLHAKNMERME